MKMRISSIAIVAMCLLAGCGPVIEKMVENQNTLTIRNRSGKNLTKVTVKRGNGPTLTMKAVDDGSTRGTFITCGRDETQLVVLCGYMPSGQTISTNFPVVVSPKRLQHVDVEIDTGMVFHVTAKSK